MALNLKKIGAKIGPLTKTYDWKDLVMYGLGVGAGYDDLSYCYEDGLKAVPSFGAAVAFPFLTESGLAADVNPAGLLHGEQDVIFHNPIPPKGTLTTQGKIRGMFDKGKEKGALLITQADTYHDSGQKLFTNIFTLFCRLDGGFGGANIPPEEVEFPDRAPDMEDLVTPTVNQPLLYRLSGDVYPLHADTKFAQVSGFDRPIMHGLCTQGYACRILIENLFPGQPERMKRLRVRFSRPLYPGTPILIQIWKTEENKALFRVVNKDTGDIAIDRGIVEWISEAESELRAKQTGIRFDGQTAIITGSGGGLGKAYALAYAERGANVVVNDVSADNAQKVVDEIEAMGAKAVVSTDSVDTPEGGRAIVDKAISTFGKVDVLVNNAGILRDKSFAKMEPADFDQVLSVHLKGAYNVTRPAFINMRENNFGRIIMTASAAGLFGNFGQANYSSAKAGCIGLMNTLELEGDRNDIKVNTIAPVAATNMTDGLMPEDLFSKVKPECVAPMVLYLTSELCSESGKIFNAGMGYFGRTAVVMGPGIGIGEAGDIPTVEDIQANWRAINNLKGAKECHDTNLSVGPMLEAFDPKSAEDEGDEKLTVQTVLAQLPEVMDAGEAEGVDVVFQFKLSGADGGDYNVSIAGGECSVAEGEHVNATVTMKMDAEDFPGLMTGKLNGMQAFTTGKLKIEGDMVKSQLVEKLFKF
jgi:NAD(P)-dependent dehydrogenase (short-subunit alcohol dehydrogenase family)/putative sterol carrier protein/acyl dehydratase